MVVSHQTASCRFSAASFDKTWLVAERDVVSTLRNCENSVAVEVVVAAAVVA